MIQIKAVSRLMLALAAVHVGAVSAEYHVIQPGDVLSLIAEKKRVQSGFLLSTEQIMLTLYKLNKNVFVNGDINNLVVSAQIYIPDTTVDYIQLSKTEAQQKLRDKNYLKSLRGANSESTSAVAEAVAPRGKRDQVNYSQVQQVLENHQHLIEGLKVENQQLNKKFNLLEKTLGRVVTVQGLLTNDMVQVRAKLADVTLDASKYQNHESAVNVPELNLEANNKSKATNIALMPTAEELIKPAQQDVPKDDVKKVLPNQQDLLKEMKENSVASVGQILAPAKARTSEKPTVPNHTPSSGVSSNNAYYNPLIIGGISFAALLTALLVRYLRRRKAEAFEDEFDFETDMQLVKVDDEPAFDVNEFNANTDLGDDLSVPVKSIIEKSQQASRESERDHELGSVLELLDMCLLCGDYEQAHAVTLKALAEHKNSTILKKKLAFIERKKAKL